MTDRPHLRPRRPADQLGRAVFAGERSAAVLASAAGDATGHAPQPLPLGGVSAGVGAWGVLGAGAGAGAVLAVLASLLFLFRAGGSLSWLSFELLHRPNSAPITAITERPG